MQLSLFSWTKILTEESILDCQHAHVVLFCLVFPQNIPKRLRVETNPKLSENGSQKTIHLCVSKSWRPRFLDLPDSTQDVCGTFQGPPLFGRSLWLGHLGFLAESVQFSTVTLLNHQNIFFFSDSLVNFSIWIGLSLYFIAMWIGNKQLEKPMWDAGVQKFLRRSGYPKPQLGWGVFRSMWFWGLTDVQNHWPLSRLDNWMVSKVNNWMVNLSLYHNSSILFLEATKSPAFGV